MGREQARQLVSFLAGQLGAYHGGSGRPKIGICHKAMITGRPPSSGDQHAEICPIRVIGPSELTGCSDRSRSTAAVLGYPYVTAAASTAVP